MVDDTLTCRYVLRLLRAIVKSNVRNGIALHKRIIFNLVFFLLHCFLTILKCTYCANYPYVTLMVFTEISAFTPVLHTMPPEFSFKMSHLGLPDLLSEMCRDNKAVLTNISEHIIDHFISILRQARDFKYIGLLGDVSSLCTLFGTKKKNDISSL